MAGRANWQSQRPVALSSGEGQSTHLRPTVSRFGGMIEQGHSAAIPMQSWETGRPPLWGSTPAHNFETRHAPAHAVVAPGVPGYTGHRPHGRAPPPNVFGVNAAPPTHDSTYAASSTDKQPFIMPVVGYSGHLRATHESHASFGTSHWKNSGQVTSNVAPAARLAGQANRDAVGRPFNGQLRSSPQQTAEEAQRQRDADEANEILELRSMGIRAIVKNGGLSKGFKF